MKSVSINSLGVAVLHSETTYASRPNKRCNAWSLNLLLHGYSHRSSKSLFFFFLVHFSLSCVSSDAIQCVDMRWSHKEKNNHVFILIWVSIQCMPSSCCTQKLQLCMLNEIQRDKRTLKFPSALFCLVLQRSSMTLASKWFWGLGKAVRKCVVLLSLIKS